VILVTGSTGLVGAHVLFELAKKNKHIRALKRINSDVSYVSKIFSFYAATDAEKLLSKIEWVIGDVLDSESLNNAMKGVSFVYHAAAVVSFNAEMKSTLYDVNVAGTRNVINACILSKVLKLCYVSSIAAIGRDGHQMVHEELAWQFKKDISEYAKSKYKAEQLVWGAASNGLNFVIVNPSIIIGPGNWDTGSMKIFKTVFKGLKFYTKGITGFVDVRDVARIMCMLQESDVLNQRFIVSSQNIPYKELFFQIADAFNVSRPIFYASPFISALAWRVEAVKSFFLKNTPLITKETARTAHKKYHYSNAKVCKTLDYQFIPVNETVKNAVAYFKQFS